MNYHGIEISGEAIAAFCRRHSIRRLSLFGSILRDDFSPQSDIDVLVEFEPLFGSILRDDFSPQSDIDVLVEFEPGKTPGFGFVAIQEELSNLFGRSADLQTPASLSKYFRDEVLHEAEALYVAA